MTPLPAPKAWPGQEDRSCVGWVRGATLSAIVIRNLEPAFASFSVYPHSLFFPSSFLLSSSSINSPHFPIVSSCFSLYRPPFLEIPSLSAKILPRSRVAIRTIPQQPAVCCIFVRPVYIQKPPVIWHILLEGITPLFLHRHSSSWDKIAPNPPASGLP